MSNTFTKLSLTMDPEGLIVTQLCTTQEGSMSIACVVMESRDDHLKFIEDLQNSLVKWDE